MNKNAALNAQRLSFLEDTVAFYAADPKGRRSLMTSPGGFPTCVYRTDDGRSCAIGRHIPDELYTSSIEGGSASSGDVMACLPNEITELGCRFLNSVQRLHDDGGNWEEDGLSTYGKVMIDRIKANINDHSYDF